VRAIVRYRVRAESKAAVLGDGELVIGRSSYCSLVLEHASVSRVHASLKLRGDEIELTDLASSNGTFVGGKRIKTPTMVKPGDAVRIGTLDLAIEAIRPREAFDTSKGLMIEEGDTTDIRLADPRTQR
jgi:pSer/pThr/pTyr-binding forkhead associated (FHA) protein